jgi:hypothetical protein
VTDGRRGRGLRCSRRFVNSLHPRANWEGASGTRAGGGVPTLQRVNIGSPTSAPSRCSRACMALPSRQSCPPGQM